jgi:hypothetical protein
MTDERFQPIPDFGFDVNRSERAQQARWLVPLLAQPEGRVWFLDRLGCLCTSDEARAANAFHFVFPLRDIFTADYYRCRGNLGLETEFIAHYNPLFSMPADFGIEDVWRTAPGGQIRHPGAGGKGGWYEDFLRERVPDLDLYQRARNLRRMLGTEADALLLTARHVILVECKYKGSLDTEQYERHIMMGETLARRLHKAFRFGMVVERERDPDLVRLEVPYVCWREIEARLRDLSRGATVNCV